MNAIGLLFLSFVLFLLSASLATADSINVLDDFRSDDLTGIMTGFFKTADGSIDSVIEQTELNSLKVTDFEFITRYPSVEKKSRDVKGNFSYDDLSNISALSLASRA